MIFPYLLFPELPPLFSTDLTGPYNRKFLDILEGYRHPCE